MQYKLNIVGQSDGIARSWFDDSLALERTNLLYRETDNLKTDYLFFESFLGGQGTEWA